MDNFGKYDWEMTTFKKCAAAIASDRLDISFYCLLLRKINNCLREAVGIEWISVVLEKSFAARIMHLNFKNVKRKRGSAVWSELSYDRDRGRGPAGWSCLVGSRGRAGFPCPSRCWQRRGPWIRPCWLASQRSRGRRWSRARRISFLKQEEEPPPRQISADIQ